MGIALLKIIKNQSKRNYLFLLVLAIPFLTRIKDISTIQDIFLYLIFPFCIVAIVSFSPTSTSNLKQNVNKLDTFINDKHTFYFCRLSRSRKYYIIIFFISLFFLFVCMYEYLIYNSISIESLSIAQIYGMFGGFLSVFLGMSFWKKITDDFDVLIKNFYNKLQKEKINKHDELLVSWTAYFYMLMYNTYFEIIFALFWILMCLVLIKPISIVSIIIYSVLGFVQTTTGVLVGISLGAIFNAGRAAYNFEISIASIYKKNFGDFFITLGNEVKDISIMILLVPGLIVTFPIVSPSIMYQYPNQVKLDIILFCFGQFFVFIFGLYGGHLGMKKIHISKEKDLMEKLGNCEKSINNSIKGTIEYLCNIEEHRMLLEEQEHLDSISTWPISARGGMEFVVLLVGVILNMMANYTLNMILI